MYNRVTSFIKSIFPNNKYLVYERGDWGIVLSAPHGGRIKPVDMPTREYGKVREDTYTRRIITYLAKNLKKKPYYIYSDLHRSKLDLNRDLQEAAQGNPKAAKVWNLWNSVLTDYIAEAKSKYRKVLYIDIHSQSVTDSFHLGYDISAKEYRSLMTNMEIDVKTSMFGLGNNQFELLFGDGSFADSISRGGFKIYYPESDETYFNGGRDIKKFTGNFIGGIQIEIPIKVCGKRLDDVCEVLTYSINHFAERFLEKHARNKYVSRGQ